MASAYQCICGEVIPTNLFAGNNMQLLAEESYFLYEDDLTANELEKHQDQIIEAAKRVSVCSNCHRLAIIVNGHFPTFYEPIPPDSYL